MPSRPISLLSILILSSHLRLGLFPSDFLTKPCIYFSFPPYASHLVTLLTFGEGHKS
jgi:hypothetical protein